jgi:hypothetical protein
MSFRYRTRRRTRFVLPNHLWLIRAFLIVTGFCRGVCRVSVENFFEPDKSDAGRGFSTARRKSSRRVCTRVRGAPDEMDTRKNPDFICVFVGCSFFARAIINVRARVMHDCMAHIEPSIYRTSTMAAYTFC